MSDRDAKVLLFFKGVCIRFLVTSFKCSMEVLYFSRLGVDCSYKILGNGVGRGSGLGRNFLVSKQLVKF